MKSNDVSDIPKLLESIQQKAVEKYKKEHGWIPITERMPKEEEYILVSFENYTLPDIGRYENDGNDKFYPGDDEETYASYGLIVNAWMPVPVTSYPTGHNLDEVIAEWNRRIDDGKTD